jgi:hypothetical protein
VDPGDQWRHRKTRETVKIDVYEFGFLSISILREGRWFRSQSLWDETEFKRQFEPINAHPNLQ